MADILDPNAQAQMSPMELQVQQQALERQRAIATMLQKESMASPDGQMVIGHYVAPSAMQYLAKLAQGLLGNSQQSDLDARQLGLAKQYGDSQMRMAQALINGGQSDASTSAPTGTPTPSNPAIANSPISLPADNGELRTFKNAPQYVGATSPDAPSMPPPPPARTGNPLFKGMSAPVL